jgi:hypothetical protein
MNEQQERIWDALASLDSKTVLRTLTDYHGLQLFDEGFAEFLVDEGIMEVLDEDEEDEED